jgi:hypothetical protein
MSRKGIEHILRSGWAVAIGLVFASCGGGSSTPAQGTLGAACYPNESCNAGLLCVAGICTIMPVGLDASAIPDAPLVLPDAPLPGPDLAPPPVDTTVVKQDACVPNCTNKACGADDGCAGKCKTGTCAAGSTCQNGFCCGCKAGQQCCQGTCTALAADPLSCGICGNACTAGMSCVGGACGVCTPNCAGKTCGPDGCGGVCGTGTCTAGQGCVAGTCTSCNPACSGLECGPDGCGGTCGKCAAGKVCTSGKCQTCTASCSGKQCGEDDGCGGICQTGTCAGGGTCSAGACIGVCIPNCAGKNCGSDGCGGTCGTCAEGMTCSAAGACQCKSTCATTGYLCGSDGCGGICGTACTGATPTCVPAKGCKPAALTVGCADLTREGFADMTTYPTLAGCQAKWPTLSLRTSTTLTPCGNDLRDCPTAADACAEGWHICTLSGWPGDLTDRVDRAHCMSADAGTGIFVGASEVYTASSVAPMACADYSANTACCGMGCTIINRNAAYWTGDVPVYASQLCIRLGSSGDLGVLCCKNPEITGH